MGSLRESDSSSVALSPRPFFDLVKDTWTIFRSNWKLAIGGPALFIYVPLLLVGVPVFIIAFIAAFIVAIINKNLVGLAMFPIGLVGVILYALAVNRIRVSWTKMVLQILRGETCSFSDFKKPIPWMNFFITMLIIGIATAIGGVLFVIPGLFIAVRTAFAPFIVVEDELGPIEAIMKSNELASGYSWQILGCIALLWFTNMASGLIPGLQIVASPAAIGYYDLVVAQIYLWRCKDTKHLR